MSDPQAGECPPRSRWKSWRAKLRVNRIPGSRDLAPAIPCRKNYGTRSWPTRAPLEDHGCRSSNAASRKSRAMCCGSDASAAFAPWKSKKRMLSDFMDRMRSGRMSASGCSTRLAPIERGATRKMGAGRIGVGKRAYFRHGRACSGCPHLTATAVARDKPGHDEFSNNSHSHVFTTFKCAGALSSLRPSSDFMAASTPPARCGTPAAVRPISTPDNAPIKVSSLHSPR